ICLHFHHFCLQFQTICLQKGSLFLVMQNKKSIQSWGGKDTLYKGNGRNVHVQTKGVYVWYVIYFTSLLYHEIIGTSTFHNRFHRNVIFEESSSNFNII